MKWGDQRLPDAFWDRVVPEPMSGCWLWIGGATVAGYGVFKRKYTHRISLGVTSHIPKGMHTDHLCRVVSCCNPDHLEVVTPRENIVRGMKGSMRTHCKHEHEYTPDNTWRHPDGCRYCRKCKLIANSKFYHATKGLK